MPTFNYSARDKNGSLVRGTVVAEDLKDSKKEIFKLGYIPIEVTLEGILRSSEAVNTGDRVEVLSAKFQTPSNVKQSIKGFFDRVTLDEMLMFNQQFHTIYLVGIPILRGLKLIEVQTDNQYFKKILSSISADVSDGQSLDVAFAKHPQVFDPTYVNLVKSGIASGKLDTILENISKLTEQQVENRERINSAMFYPKIILLFITGVFLMVVYFLIPKIKIFFDKFGGELPPITRFVVGVSDFMVGYWYLIGLIVGGAFYVFRKWISTTTGRHAWDRFLLKLPLFGELIQQIECNTFASILELLHEGGVPIVEALRLTRDSLRNIVFKHEVDRIILSVERGEGMAAAIVSGKVFPPMVGGLISVAEEAGAITTVLNRISAYYKMRINYRLSNLSKALEPILLVVIGAVVLVLALAVFMPIWKMNSLVKR